MNATKAAAFLALLATIIATGYLLYQAYENIVLLRSSIDSLNGIGHSAALEYWLPGGIALAALIASLALFGAAQKKH